MEHLLLKAATTVATDQGEFEAVISTATIDRERDIVDPAGFVRALQKWVPLGKKVPLAWNHSSKPEDQIGYIDPATVRVQGDEVLAKGKIDLDSTVGKEAWRMVKMGTLGFSFGYLVPTGGSSPRKGGGRHIKELDVFEVTATPAPMNGDTRVVGWKSVDGVPVPVTEDEEADAVLVPDSEPEEDAKALRRRADEIALEHASGGESERKTARQPAEPELSGSFLILKEGKAIIMDGKAGFDALTPHDKLSVYYAMMDAGALPVREDAAA